MLLLLLLFFLFGFRTRISERYFCTLHTQIRESFSILKLAVYSFTSCVFYYIFWDFPSRSHTHTYIYSLFFTFGRQILIFFRRSFPIVCSRFNFSHSSCNTNMYYSQHILEMQYVRISMCILYITLLSFHLDYYCILCESSSFFVYPSTIQNNLD